MTKSPCIAQAAILIMLTGFASWAAESPDGASAGEDGATGVAAAYLDAMESGDLAAAGSLFAAESSVFESGGQEGDWAHYREHHIGPELSQIKGFMISRGENEIQESRDGSMAFVAWPIEYRIELEDLRIIESLGTVTFVLVRVNGGYRIRHLHWSSRRSKTDA